VGFVAVLYGLHGGDVWLSLSGLLLGACFALDAIRDSCHRIHLWLLSDTARFDGGER
jgi:hypothetical protein